MAILWRKLVRDLWQSKGQFISVLIVVVIGVMFYSGINSTFMNLTDASNKYYTEYRLGDIWASFTKTPEDIERKVKTLPFVKMATGRIVQDVNTNISGDNAVLRLITLPDEKKDIVNDIFIKSGKYFDNSQDNQCLLEDSFFKANNLKIGDYIYPIINGSEVKLKVKGSVINPEYVYAVKDSSELVADSKKFGLVYIKKSFGKAVLGFNGSINNLSITVKDGTDIEAAKDDLEKFLKDFAVTGINDRDSQLSYKTVSEKLKGFQSFGAGFPVIFFIVAAVIIYITMGRMVENQRTQIGVLKAFGFNNLQILIHYLSYSAFIAILGSIIGAVFGVFLAKGFTQLINAYFNFPNTNAHMYPG
ncbi:MAG TPA: FtsX-like permease family protein, partial [Clostridia bacterium]